MRGDGVGRLLRGLLYCLLAVLSVGVGCDATTARPASVKEAVSAIEGIAEHINRMSVSETPNNWAIAEEATCVIGDLDESSPPVTADITCVYKFPISLNGKQSDNASRWRAVVNYKEGVWSIDHIFVSFKFYDSEKFRPVGDVVGADLDGQPGLRRVREMWLSAAAEIAAARKKAEADRQAAIREKEAFAARKKAEADRQAAIREKEATERANAGRTSSSARRNRVVPNLAKTKIVQIGVGKATITDKKGNGKSHVKIECNNGLVIDADWERNSFNDYGYDIYEPTINMTTNRLAVMLTARGVIASYLRGEYD
jgi:hypothetical protein